MYTWIDIALLSHPGSANVQPIKPRWADHTKSSGAFSLILDIFILLLCNSPQQRRGAQHRRQTHRGSGLHIESISITTFFVLTNMYPPHHDQNNLGMPYNELTMLLKSFEFFFEGLIFALAWLPAVFLDPHGFSSTRPELTPTSGDAKGSSHAFASKHSL